MSKVNILHLSWVMSTKAKGYGACVKTCKGIKATLSFFYCCYIQFAYVRMLIALAKSLYIITRTYLTTPCLQVE